MQLKQNQSRSGDKTSAWQKTQYTNLIRYVPSGTYFARLRVRGKLMWKSLKTDKVTVAKMRLDDLQKEERTKAESGQLVAKGKVLVKDAIEAYRQNGFRPVIARNKKDAQHLKPAALAYYEQRVKKLLKTWPRLEQTEVRRLTEKDCKDWAQRQRLKMSPTVFNHTLGVLRAIIDFGIHAGARYDNPAIRIMRESEVSKTLDLPEPAQFEAFLAAIENAGGRFSKDCADLVRFLAFGGFRKSEAANVTWRDCDFARNQMTLRGDPKTGLKNRRPGEIRIVPMIPEMRELLKRIKAERLTDQPESPVMAVNECQKAMDRAAKAIGMKRITHHDLRHMFATRCIESGVDVPTFSKWLGHRDGGALAMRVYGHLREKHSTEMAQKVCFSAPVSPPGAAADPKK